MGLGSAGQSGTRTCDASASLGHQANGSRLEAIPGGALTIFNAPQAWGATTWVWPDSAIDQVGADGSKGPQASIPRSGQRSETRWNGL